MTDLFSNTPDGSRYRAMSHGTRVEQPYHLRWLAPYVCRTDLAWIICAFVSVAATAGLAVIYSGNRWPAALLVLGLPGITLFNLHHPILVDAPAIALALAAAISAQHDLWYLAVPLVLAAGATKETAPMFSAAWAWSPLLLVGMIAPLLRWVFVRPGIDALNDDASVARVGFRQKLIDQRIKQADPAWYVMPWGVCILGLAGLNLQMVVVLALAYAQLAVATDTARLYQWAAPPLVAATCANVSPKWWLPLVVIHCGNVLRGTGL